MKEEDYKAHIARAKSAPTPPVVQPSSSVRIQKAPQIVNAPKYRNQKVTIDGIKFDSKKEAMRYRELRLLQEAGEILGLKCQQKFNLVPPQKRSDGKTERGASYVADFIYYRGSGMVVEDVKGMKTPLYILKRKLLLMVHGITIHEV